jgi:hypothetical protein
MARPNPVARKPVECIAREGVGMPVQVRGVIRAASPPNASNGLIILSEVGSAPLCAAP